VLRQAFEFITGTVIPILSVYLGFKAYPWWTILAIGAAALLIYAVPHAEEMADAFGKHGLRYLGTVMVISWIIPGALFAIGRGISYLVHRR